jgi:hypothetical protein
MCKVQSHDAVPVRWIKLAEEGHRENHARRLLTYALPQSRCRLRVCMHIFFSTPCFRTL